MKEGLEKHFEGGVVQPENLVAEEVPTQDAPVDEVAQEQVQEETAPLVEEVQEVKPELETAEEVVEELTVQETKPETNLPENVDKLVSFLNENPGSTLEDYVGLNKSYDDLNEKQLLNEYYSKTKSHLDREDIDYLLNKKFDINVEELDEEEVRERRIALKEELSTAKYHLNATKDKYYADLKVNAGSVTQDKELQERQREASVHFQTETDKVFEGFKGFTFDLGEGNKKIRYKVENADKLKEYQSDLDNVLSDYIEDGKLKDAQGYHKALFALKNPDRIAQLFYEQGKADAIKASTADSKNIDFSHTHRPPDSNTKLKPGAAREIVAPQSSDPRIALKYWDK